MIRIDKSRLTPQERELYEQLVAKARVDAPAPPAPAAGSACAEETAPGKKEYSSLGSDDDLLALLMGAPETEEILEEGEEEEGFSDAEQAELEALLAGARAQVDRLWDQHMNKNRN